jgi:hypothetical protein
MDRDFPAYVTFGNSTIEVWPFMELHKLFSEFNLFMPLWTDAIYLQGRSLSDGTQPGRQMISGDKANAANQAAENS